MTTAQEHAVSSSNQQGQIQIDFGNPPVGETATGFYFQTIEGWSILHHGVLWERFKTKYPDYEFLPPIVEAPFHQSTVSDLSSLPLRVGFVDKTKTQLVQMQNGLLLHNWRKTAHISEYLHYEAVRSQLRDDWSTLKNYLREMSLKEPTVTRCQMDYFNHLVRGEEWQDFSDLTKIFTVWRGLEQSTLSGKLQMASFSVSYRIDKGTVNVMLQPAIRASDGREILQFTLSSSVVPTSSADDEIFTCLDESHSNAARAFIDFTTAEARERWEQKK